MKGEALIRAIDWRTLPARSVKAPGAQVGLAPVSVSRAEHSSSSVKESMPQPVWWMRRISSVPSRCWLIDRERIVSSVTRPPALRMTCASPGASPSAAKTSTRESMQATTATFCVPLAARPPRARTSVE